MRDPFYGGSKGAERGRRAGSAAGCPQNSPPQKDRGALTQAEIISIEDLHHRDVAYDDLRCMSSDRSECALTHKGQAECTHYGFSPRFRKPAEQEKSQSRLHSDVEYSLRLRDTLARETHGK